MKRLTYILGLISVLLACSPTDNTHSTEKHKETDMAPSLEKFQDGIHHWNLFHRNDYYPRYKADQYVNIADNLLAYQNTDGGWPKNIDWLGALNLDSLRATFSEKDKRSTLDNNNVFPQIEYLAKVFALTKEERFKHGSIKGIRFIFAHQYPEGGWRGWDADAFTFNDQVMTGVMNLLLDLEEQLPHYQWLDEWVLDSAHVSLQRAVDITLKCQISINNKKAAWCQQHHKVNYKPVKGRSYELASVTAWESTDVLRFLVRLPEPSEKIIEAVKTAANWLNAAKIEGIRLDKIELKGDDIINDQYPYDLLVVEDSTAKPIWSRYYDLEKGLPFLCKLDGTVVYNLSEISPARRTGYSWYGYWPEQFLAVEYPAWLKKHSLKE